MATSSPPAVQLDLFLADNPFRALCVGSAEPIASLRRKADAASKAAKVGLPSNVPLSELLGTCNLEELPYLIRSLVTDARRRSCYRIMWPLSQATIPFLIQGGTLKSDQLPCEELTQLLFISSLLAYLENGSPADAANALDRWEELCTSEDMDRRLSTLLVQEDGIDLESAYDVALDAQRTIALAILRRVSSDAASSWDAGEGSKGAQLIEVIVNSPIDDDLEALALEPIAEAADRLKERVELTIREMGEWRRGSSTDPPKEVVQLERISGALRGLLPSAEDWEQAAHRWTTALVWRMRQESLRLNHADDNVAAVDVVRAAIKLANTTEQKEKLRADLRQLENIVADEKAQAAYAGIEKISSAPSLGTLNGFGTKVYGHDPFTADRRFYFTVLYFTAVFIPVFPIARYLVQDGAGGGWRFLGKTRWTRGMKIHLAVSCLLMISYGVYVANMESDTSDGSTSPEANSYSSQYSPPSSRSPATTPFFISPQADSTTDATDTTSAAGIEGSDIDYVKRVAERDAKEKKRTTLERELEALKTEIASLKSEIDDKGSALDDQRSTLSSLKAEIDASAPNPYSQEEVDAHNAKVVQYESHRAEFNDAVRSYNRKVNLQKKKVRRYNGIVDALNASSR